MARVSENGPHGVLVRGRRLHADGTADTTAMLVRPEKAQIWRGALWSAEPVEVRPDATGAFAVALPPGAYQVETTTWTGRIVVPESAEPVRFEEIVQTA